jgi:hypothetical protein
VTAARRLAMQVRVPRVRQAWQRAALLAAMVFALAPPAAHADFLPSRPISLWNDRLVVSSEITFTAGSRDDGYFNALDYSHDAFNLLTMSVSAEMRAHDRVSVLGEIVDEVGLRSRQFGPSDRNVLRPYALYLRVQPFESKRFFVQAGRVPPVFGAFVREVYGSGNPLIGLPLAYQYPTVVRPDVVPPSVSELAANRGEGWYVRYPRASFDGHQGVPMLSARRWDTGVQARWEQGLLEVAVAVTNGSLSKPLTIDDNDGKQFSARLGFKPLAALSLGVSAARGEFVADEARQALIPAEQSQRYRQDAFGVDAEVSHGYFVLRGEVIGTRWSTPFASGEPEQELAAWTGWLEGRIKLSPRWTVAARGERLQFSELAGWTPGGAVDGGSSSDHPYGGAAPPGETWDAPVTRGEAGVNYRLLRNVRLKAAYQYDWRDGGRVRREGHAAVQVAYWF